MMKNRIKTVSVLTIALCFLLGAGVIPAVQSGIRADAATEKIWTYEEVDSLEKLREVPAEQIAAWETYDSRKYDIVTSVKNQGSSNLCWVYGSLAAMETSILRQGFSNETYQTLDLDEKEFAKAIKGKWDDPLNLADSSNNQKNGNAVAWDAEGAVSQVVQFAARGQGVYQAGEISGEAPQERYSSYLLRKAMTCENKIDEIKQLIAQYGGVAFTYGVGYRDYQVAKGAKSHCSFIVGWDDTVPQSKFEGQATSDGAWIVKNSYGEQSNLSGYLYLSYESVLYEITAFDMMPAEEYDWCYNYSDKIYSSASYDTYAPYDAESAEYVAIYKAQKGEAEKEYLKGVSVGAVGENMKITVSVYTDVAETACVYNTSAFDPKSGTLCQTLTYDAPYTGLYTIPLNQFIEVKQDSCFTVLVKIAGGAIVKDNFAYRSGETMTYVWDSGKWNNCALPLPPYLMGVLCIKALTVVQAEDVGIDLSEYTLSLSQDTFIYNGAAHTPAVTLQKGGEILPAENYQVAYENNINAGTATVKVTGTGNCTGELQTDFQIKKAASPALPAEFEHLAAPEGAKQLGEIGLPAGWEWQTPSTLLVAGAMKVFVVYVGADSGNYETKVFEIVLTVPEAEPEISELQKKLQALYDISLSDLTGSVSDYEMLLKIKEALDAFTQEELQALEEEDAAKVAMYRERVEAWNGIVDGAEEVIGLSQAVAAAPLQGLFEATAALSVLAGMKFVLRKR